MCFDLDKCDINLHMRKMKVIWTKESLRKIGMTEEIDAFIDYLQQVKKSSVNTTMSYRRDLTQLWEYLKQQGIDEPSRVTKTSLNSYILYLEGQGKASTTISRVVASIIFFSL